MRESASLSVARRLCSRRERRRVSVAVVGWSIVLVGFEGG